MTTQQRALLLAVVRNADILSFEFKQAQFLPAGSQDFTIRGVISTKRMDTAEQEAANVPSVAREI